MRTVSQNCGWFNKCNIRNMRKYFYIQGRKVPTIPKLLPVIKERIFHVVENLVVKLWKTCNKVEEIPIKVYNADWQGRYYWRLKCCLKKKQTQKEGCTILQTWNTSWQEPDFRKCCQSNYKRIQKTGWFYSMQWTPVVSFVVQNQYTSLVRQNKISWPHQQGPLWKMVGQ